MNIKLSPFSIQDLDESRKYYNEQKESLGDEFVTAVLETFERIKVNHNQFPVVLNKMRKANIERFPFCVFFVVELHHVYVLGIFHDS